MQNNLIEIEIAYAEPEQQIILNIQVPKNTDVAGAIALSGILNTEILRNYSANNNADAMDKHDQEAMDKNDQDAIDNNYHTIEYWADRIAIFGEKVTLATILKAGDRIEMLRPLLRNPKEARHAKVKILHKVQAREKQKKQEELKASKRNFKNRQQIPIEI